MAILLMLKLVPPALDSVTSCTDELPMSCVPKLRDDGEIFMVVTTPKPVRIAVCGPLGSSSLTARLPKKLPVVRGVEVTLMVQDTLGASVVPQSFVWAKPAGVVMLLICSGALPLLVRIRGIAGLVTPIGSSGKFTPPKESCPPGNRSVPLRKTLCGLPAALSETFTNPA